LALVAFLPFAHAASGLAELWSDWDSGYSASGLVQSPDYIYAGDDVSLRFSFAKISGYASDVNVYASVPLGFGNGSSSPQNLEFNLGSFPAGEGQEVKINFEVPSDAVTGNYFIYLYAKEGDGSQVQFGSIYFEVNEEAMPGLIMASVAADETVYTGESSLVTVSLTNTGLLDAGDVLVSVSLDDSIPLTALGQDQVYVDEIKAGETKQVSFTVGADADATPGFYALPLSLSFNVNNRPQDDVTQNLGVKVDSRTGMLVSGELTDDSAGANVLSVTIANTGDTAVRGVYARAYSDDYSFTGSADKFIGTLNLDDSSTLTLTLASLKADGSVTVEVSYKDPLNVEHTVTQVIPVSSGVGASADASVDAPAVDGRMQGPGGAGGFGGLLSISRGLGDLLPYVIGVVVLVVAFLAYRFWRKRKEKAAARGKGA